MEDVSFLGETEPGFRVRRYLLQDAPSHRSRVARHRTELCEHHRSPSHQRVQDRHFRTVKEAPSGREVEYTSEFQGTVYGGATVIINNIEL